ncbi:MAG: hypothetical protein CMJ18_02215 [Phycisphaeraceae bacterium]|nr:hypothetical protein [Phycisphaeraceae bacterium]
MSSTSVTGKTFRMKRPYRVIINEDGGRGFRNYVAPLTKEQYLSAIFDVQVKGRPVDALFWCGLQNPAGATWYCTKVGERGGLLSWPRIKQAWEWHHMKTREELIRQGHDPLAIVCDRGHELGTDIWLSFRANDVHHSWDPHYAGSKMTRKYRDRTDLRVGPDHGRQPHVTFAERQWDYAKQEVRDFVLALLSEALLDYDVDGVELDFMRHAFLFAKSDTEMGTLAMNDLMRALRGVADQAEKKKGRPQGIAARVPSFEPACAEAGIDWRTWAGEGLVDVITASTHQPTEQEADLAPFVDGCRDTGTLVSFCMEPSPATPHVTYDRSMIHVYGGAPTGLSTENYRSMALGAYQQEADAVYIFNTHFLFERFDTHTSLEFLDELHDRELMAGRDQRYIVSRQPPRYSHDWFFECAPPRPLPKWVTREEPEYTFIITVGADLERAADEQRLRAARLRLCLAQVTPPDIIEVCWNGQPLAGDFEPPLVPGTWQHWYAIHFWVADLVGQDRAPKAGRHEITLRLVHRNHEIEEGIIIHTAEFDVRFWHRPGVAHAMNEMPGMFR